MLNSRKFPTVVLSLKKEQKLRRNLTPLQRIAITERYRPVFEEKAKENMATSTGGSSPQLSANLPKAEQKVDTRKELAKLAGVGERTYSKAVAILVFIDDSVDCWNNLGYNEINKI